MIGSIYRSAGATTGALGRLDNTNQIVVCYNTTVSEKHTFKSEQKGGREVRNQVRKLSKEVNSNGGRMR
jgi:hypothetical protein